MSGINSLLILIIIKSSKLDLKNPKKIFFLRVCLFLKFFNAFYKFYVIKKEKNKPIGIKNFLSLNNFWFKRSKNFVLQTLFHFLAGKYALKMSYVSLLKGIIRLPNYWINLCS